MSDPQVMFDELARTNPVKDVSILHQHRPAVDDIIESLRDGNGFSPVSPGPPTIRGFLMAAAALMILLGFALPLVWLAQRDQIPVQPADQIEVIRQDAVDVALQWLEAVRQGDIETVIDLSGPSASGESDRRLAEWLAGVCGQRNADTSEVL